MEVLIGIALAIGVLGYFLLEQPASIARVFNMSKLSPSQIAQYASDAGFQGDDLVTAVAIALAESGGDPNIEGDNGTSYGLWQIHWTVHPEFDKTQLKDPAYNAMAAFDLYTKRSGFNDWSTYTVPNQVTGVLPYTNFLDAANTAVNS